MIKMIAAQIVQQTICAAIILIISIRYNLWFRQVQQTSAADKCRRQFVPQTICAADNLCSKQFVQQSF